MAAASQVPPGHETLANVDNHVSHLKGEVEKLRKNLQHWQTLDAEYESLKEEIEVLSETPTAEELQGIKAGFDGDVLDDEKLDNIFGQPRRSRHTIVDILEQRIKYVSQNVRTLKTQVEKAELAHLEAQESNEHGAIDENGPPITEILEELDEYGNVVSFSLNRPGETLPRVQAALEKAGIDTVALDPLASASSNTQRDANPNSLPTETPSQKSRESTSAPVASQPAKVKESISLPAESQPVAEQTAPEVSRMARRVDGIMKTAREQEKISSQPAIVPDDEDEDDAELRQQMLKYSMGEMGAVVAELNLEDDEDDDDDDDDDGDEFDDDEWMAGDDDLDEDDDEEDKYGRFTGRMVTDKYRRRMLQLEVKLGVKSRFTQKLEQETKEKDSDDDDDGEGIGRIRINENDSPAPASSSVAPTKSIVKDRNASRNEPKKGVRFANELDIAPPTIKAATALTQTEAAKTDVLDIVEPLSDLVIERAPAPKTAASTSTRKPSRFKQATTATQPYGEISKGPLDVPASFLSQQQRQDEGLMPTGPEGTTIADTLVEKQTVSRPTDPSELDDEMIHMGVAEEHHRLRSLFIRRNGDGFVKEQESATQPLDEIDDSGAPLSRFKAARLSRQ